jgi:hypothetical protein
LDIIILAVHVEASVAEPLVNIAVSVSNCRTPDRLSALGTPPFAETVIVRQVVCDDLEFPKGRNVSRCNAIV